MTAPADELTNVPHSVRDRLANVARASGTDMQVVLSRYGTERLLYRISCSEYRDSLVLKGAWLFYVWDLERRATRDVDLLGYLDSDVEAIERMFRNVGVADPEVDDGVIFDTDTLRVDPIQEDGGYRGLRARMIAMLGRTRIHTQVDLGFGEALAENPEAVELPVLLDFPAPRMRVYHAEAVIAEKLEAIVKFGRATTRFKDFFDIYVLSAEREFEGRRLQLQVDATFRHRETEVPATIPGGLADEFGEEEASQRNWAAFLRRVDATGAPRRFADALAAVRGFTWPVLRSIVKDEEFIRRWKPGEGWI